MDNETSSDGVASVVVFTIDEYDGHVADRVGVLRWLYLQVPSLIGRQLAQNFLAFTLAHPLPEHVFFALATCHCNHTLFLLP